MIVPFFKPPITEREVQAVAETVRSCWLTFGAKTEEFEQKFAKYIGAPYAVMLDNCTAALFLACEHFKEFVLNKDEKIVVGVPSLTCAATALAPIHAGFGIEFVDLKSDESFLMDKYQGWSIPVSYAGKYCNQSYTIVEDFAHRIERNCFTGNLQAFSFYVTKNMTTGEGGMIACATKEQADWFRKARLYGNGNAIYERKKMYETGDEFWWFESEFLGWKANPTDLSASIGLVQLERLDELNSERARVAKRYNKAFNLKEDRSPWHLYPILVENRKEFMYYMKGNDVHCSVHFPPLHMMKAFEKYRKALPNTEYVYQHIVSLPFYPYMTEKEQDYVINLVLDWNKNHEFIPRY